MNFFRKIPAFFLTVSARGLLTGSRWYSGIYFVTASKGLEGFQPFFACSLGLGCGVSIYFYEAGSICREKVSL